MKLLCALVSLSTVVGCASSRSRPQESAPAPDRQAPRIITVAPIKADTWFVRVWRPLPPDSTFGIIVFDNIAAAGYGRLEGYRSLSLGSFVTPAVAADTSIQFLNPQWPVYADFGAPDSVDISLTPRVTDWGFHLIGRIAGDSMRGVICEDSFSHRCNPRGPFLMVRYR